MNKKKILLSLLVFVVIALGGIRIFYLEYQAVKHKHSTLKIVATTGMIGDVVRNIAKDKCHVTILMGPGVDPHTYEAGVKDAMHLTNADIVFYNGLHLEGPMAHSLESLSKHSHVYAVSQALNPNDILSDPDFPSGKDPHIWFDVNIWITVANFISEKLQKHDPSNAAFYQENTKKYVEKLKVLHQDIKEAINRIPLEKRKLVISHDALSYFAKAYKLELKALQGISTAEEASTYKRINLRNFIKKYNIRAIYLEYSVNHKGMYSIQEDCAKIGHPIQCLEIYSDTIGEEGTEEGTYIGAMRHNLKMIIKGLNL